MSNKEYINEAERIGNELIKIGKSNKDLDTLFNILLDDKFKHNYLNVMVYLPDILAQKKFYIVNVSPFEIKNYNS